MNLRRFCNEVEKLKRKEKQTKSSLERNDVPHAVSRRAERRECLVGLSGKGQVIRKANWLDVESDQCAVCNVVVSKPPEKSWALEREAYRSRSSKTRKV